MYYILRKIHQKASKYIVATIFSPWWVFSLKNESHMSSDNRETLRKFLFKTNHMMTDRFFGKNMHNFGGGDEDVSDFIFGISYCVLGCCVQDFTENEQDDSQQNSGNLDFTNNFSLLFESLPSGHREKLFGNLVEYSDHGYSRKITTGALKLLADDPQELAFWLSQGNVVKLLNEDNFQLYLQEKKHALVMFYSPLCPHCKQMKPEFIYAAKHFKGNKQIVFAAVDCLSEPELCKRYKIEGYPTLLYYNFAKKKKTYREGRKADDMIGFMRKVSFLQEKDASIADRVQLCNDPWIQKLNLSVQETHEPVYYEAV